MAATRPLPSSLLLFVFLLAARPSEAQQLAPLAVRPSDAAPTGREPTSFPAVAPPRDSLPRAAREISAVGTIIGGVVGGTAGTFVGFMTGAGLSHGCRGEMCQLGPALLGALLGESLGLATGAHIGSGSSDHGHVIATTLASAGIFVAGAAMGAGLSRVGNGVGAIMVPMTPALQLAAAVAIESH